MQHSDKVYVAVIAAFDEAGKLKPRRVKWEDGSTYTIDRILDVRPSAAHKAGGQGDRYTVEINGKESYLFFERTAKQSGLDVGRWFVERK